MPKIDIDKMNDLLEGVLKEGIQKSKHPEKLLRKNLMDLTSLYIPRSQDLAVDYCQEFCSTTATYATWILRDHIKDHPEDAKECCPDILDLLIELYRAEILKRVDHWCQFTNSDNPFQPTEQSVNEKTLKEILAQIEAEGKA